MRRFTSSPAVWRSGLLAWVGLCWVLVAASSAADPPALQVPAVNALAPAQRDHYQQAMAYFGADRFDLARRELEVLHQMDPAPILLFNIGQCHRRLAEHDQAIRRFGEFLASPGITRERRHEALGVIQEQRQFILEERRVVRLKQVLRWTLGGLVTAAVVGIVIGVPVARATEDPRPVIVLHP